METQIDSDIDNANAGHGTSGNAIRKITWLGMIVNLILSAMKFWAGIRGCSQAMVADAIHSLSDMTTDIAVIVGSHFWSHPPDESHPYGHQRIETLVTIFIGCVLLAAGLGIGWDAITSIHEPDRGSPKGIALVAAMISIMVKEVLYHWTIQVGKKVKSTALMANAWHHRLDAFSSIPALLAVAGAMALEGWTFLDHIGAAIVSIFIIQAALKIVWPGITELAGTGAPKETCDKIKSIALAHETVVAVTSIRTRFFNSALMVDFHLLVDGKTSVLEGYHVAQDVKSQIQLAFPDVLDVDIHVDPVELAMYQSASSDVPLKEC